MTRSGAVLLQALRGPLMLASFGVLVAIDQAGNAPFWQTWPVLFIVYGVLKLLERAADRPVTPPALGTGELK